MTEVPGAAEIQTICVSGTNGLVMVDDVGTPVHNAIMFSDRRSEAQAGEITRRHGPRLGRITGNRPMPGSFSLPIINWFREQRPDTWAKVRTLLVPAGYMVMKLTGKKSMDTSRASMTLLLDLAKRQWSEEILERENIPSHLLPDLFEPWRIVGETTPEITGLLGLRQKARVLAGCVDSVAAAVGAGVSGTEQVALMIGTTGRITISLDTPDFDARQINVCHAVPGHWTSTAAMSNSGGSLQWLVETFGHLEKTMEVRAGVPRYRLIDMAAAQSPAGAKGIIFLPYLSGERSPIWNSKARGTFFGLFEGAAWSDVTRSVMEGVAFSFKDCLTSMERSMSKKPSKFVLVGGGAKSELWGQILCDVLERPLFVPDMEDVETLGDIALAGCAAGLWPTIDEAVSTLVQDAVELRPNLEYAEVYRRRFELYKDLYVALTPLFEKAADRL